MRRFAPTVALTIVSGLAFALWTWLLFNTRALAWLDAPSAGPGVDLRSDWGQIQSAVSFTLGPWSAYITLAILAIWAWRRRLRNLSYAMAVAVPLAWASGSLLKNLIQRPRPPLHAPLMTSDGFSYPSAHMEGITTMIVLIWALVVVTRRTDALAWGLRIGGIALWFLVAYNRWILRAHYLTDIIGGSLWGTFIAAASLAMAGVHVVAPWAGRQRVGVPPVVTVIVNPTKVADWGELRRLVDASARQHGWGRPRWIETTPDDPGTEVAARAVGAGVDLVLAAGGDGTARAVAQGLAGTETALALLPAGTGNLLARNLGVPLDLADAVEAAFDGEPRQVDVVEVQADAAAPTVSLVMSGMGLDADIMSETNDDLKRAVGPVAYVVPAMAALGRPGFALTTVMDDAEPQTRPVGLALIANVGMLQAGIQLLPQARPDDGLLDLVCADAGGPVGWAGIAGQVMTGASQIGGVDRAQGRQVVLTTSEPRPYQVDGDTLGTCRRLEASIVPGALKIMLPRPES